MNQELIKLTKESIENCKSTIKQLRSRIIRLLEEVEEAEKEFSKVGDVGRSLEAALERLEEAEEKEKSGAKIEEAKLEKKALEKLMGIKGDRDFKIPEGAILEPGGERAKEKLTPEERTKKSLDDADQLIAREKERQEKKEKGWKLCLKCNRNRVAPWNKKGICSPCQLKRKTKKD